MSCKYEWQTVQNQRSSTIQLTKYKSEMLWSHLIREKASRCDNLLARVLKYGAEKLAIPLANLYNSCTINRQWPSNWKRGEWTPIFKKEDPQDSRNYIITILPVVKVFEKLISDQISKQFDSRLDPRIKAYRKRHSCETTLISLIEAWKSAR